MLSIDSQAATPVPATLVSSIPITPGPPLAQRDPPTPPETAGSSSSSEYTVPWSKMPSTITDLLTAKRWVSSKNRKLVVQIIVDDMIRHRHGQRPSRGQLREVAQKVIDEYPDSFQETEPFGNRPFAGNGCTVLFNQLESRVENMNRKPASRRTAAEGETPRKKPRHCDRYGCVEFEPAVEGPEERAALLLKK